MSHTCINLKHFIFNISSYHGSSVITFACLTLAGSFLTIALVPGPHLLRFKTLPVATEPGSYHVFEKVCAGSRYTG